MSAGQFLNSAVSYVNAQVVKHAQRRTARPQGAAAALSSVSIFVLLISGCACVSPILSNSFTAGAAMSRHVSIYKVAPHLFHTSL